MGGVGAGDHGLGGNATCVDTGTAEQLALDDRNFHSRSCQASRQERSSLAGANNDRIVRSDHYNRSLNYLMAIGFYWAIGELHSLTPERPELKDETGDRSMLLN